MDYITAKDAAGRWGVSERTVQKYCVAGRIEGAKKHANNWLLPATCQKPDDPRRQRHKPVTEQTTYSLYVSTPWPTHDPDVVSVSLGQPYRALSEATLSTYRGIYEPAKVFWRSVKPTDDCMLTAALLASTAAISSGDYELYHEINDVLSACIQKTDDPRTKALLELPNVMVTVNLTLPAVAPEWLTAGDFSLFDMQLRPFISYLYALHLRNLGDHRAMRDVARVTLALTEQSGTFTWMDIYLHLMCAAAGHLLGEQEEAQKSLKRALELGAPHGMISPYAEYITGCGGMMEDMLGRQYPQLLKPVTSLWKQVVSNWHIFRNLWTQQSISIALLPQEHHAALLLARGLTYRQTAQTLHISVNRVKGLISSVYEKLDISSREELNKHLLIY